MKLSLAWLRELVDLSGLSAAQVADALTFHVAEVEGVEAVGRALDPVRSARVLTATRHPNADRLSVCTVEAGDGVVRTVVCGAPNVAAGQVVCHAPVGATLPNGLTLSKRPVRGVESDGMLCAEDEMGLGSDHAGILVLPEGTPVGRPVSEVLGLADDVLEVNNTAITHRPDLWGHVGVARELAAVLGRKLRPLPVGAAQAALAATAGDGPAVRVDDEGGCRRYVGLALTGLVNGPSPAALRRRLEALGARSVDLLVDLTQLVLFEQGQPLHAFDLGGLAGPVRVRRAAGGEALRTLDGVDRPLAPDDLVIADERGALALAGVMGGAGSGVTAATTSIMLESACFDAARIRRTSQRLALRTDASARFEKALDPLGCLTAALRFLDLLLQHQPGARLRGGLTDVFPRPYPPVTIALGYERVRRRLGVRVSDAEARSRLLALGFGVLETRDGLQVTVPSWRATRDVSGPDDLVEEIGRTRGYGDIQPVPPVAALRPTRPGPARLLERRAGALLSLALGYAQTTCYSFYGAEDARRLGLDGVAHLTLANPLTVEQDRLELSTLPNLLRAVGRNLANEARGRLWSATRLIAPAPGAGLPDEVPVLAAVTWERDGAQDPSGALYLGAVEDLRTLVRRLVGVAPEVREGGRALAGALPVPRWLHPGRTARIESGGRLLGVVGEVAPSVLRAYGLTGRVTHAEVSRDALLAACAHAAPEYRPVHRFPVAPFDVAVLVPRRTPAQQVVDVILSAAPGQVRDVRVFDVYEGAGVPAGQRSLALSCELLDAQGTLAPAQADALRRRVQQALESAGWSVRAGAR